MRTSGPAQMDNGQGRPDAAPKAPWWLPGGHLQTIVPARLQTHQPVPYRRERWDTPDGDFIDLDWTPAPPSDTDGSTQQRPLLILFHGLEGSSQSHYARHLMTACLRRGWQGVVVHFRGCSGEDNRLLRAYHSGDSAEIDWILRRFAHCWPQGPRWSVGISLGGNALTKWAGEQSFGAKTLLSGAAAISAPLDLTISGAALGLGFNRIYTWEFLRTLKQKALRKAQRFPGQLDIQQIKRCQTLAQFDDAYTAPVHGFTGTQDYWTRASALPYVRQIELPMLLLNALNDPFVPPACLPTRQQLSASVISEQPRNGGHVGFATPEGNSLAITVFRFFENVRSQQGWPDLCVDAI